MFTGDIATSTDIIAAINWCLVNRATYNIVAMNMSLGGGLYDAECTSSGYAVPFANARQAGIVPVVSSGNDADASHLGSPACAPGAVRVGAVYDANNGGPLVWGGGLCTDATTAADQITCFSNSADFLTILAPGALITAAELMMGGTSQAAPHVAGAVAVLKDADGTLSADEVQWSMTGSDVSITDSRNGFTFPRLNLTAAIALAQSGNQPPNAPSNPSPADQAGNVSLNRALTWTDGGDPDAGDTVTFDIYFGTSPNPPRVEMNHLTTSYDPGPLSEGIYYWKVVAIDNHTFETEGPVWSFNTEIYDCTGDVIQDGGFEAGTPSAAWTEFSSLWGTPIYNGIGALDGDWYAYFGGGGAETAHVEQDVQFGDVAASLTFWLWIPTSSGNGVDTMTLRIDGAPVFTVLENDSRFTGLGYAGVQLDLTPLADGNTHTVRFEYASFSPGTSMYLDLVSMSSCGTPPLYGDEIVSDFGAARGTWHYDAGTWDKLSSWDPEQMTSWQNKVAIDFGDINGTWLYDDSTGWEKTTPWSPYVMTPFGDKLAAAFDAGRGIWLNDAGAWTQVTKWEPVQMVAVGNTLYASFGPSRGLWTYDTTAGWDKVSSWHPYNMIAWGGTLVAAFDAGRGTYHHQNPVWTKLTSWEPQHMVSWGDRLAVGFGSGKGTWTYDTEWNKISSWDAYDMISWKNQLIAAFDAGRGTWSYNETWAKLTPWEPIELDARDGAFVAAFGAGRGIWMFDTDWTQITKWDPEAMEIADTH